MRQNLKLRACPYSMEKSISAQIQTMCPAKKEKTLSILFPRYHNPKARRTLYVFCKIRHKIGAGYQAKREHISGNRNTLPFMPWFLRPTWLIPAASFTAGCLFYYVNHPPYFLPQQYLYFFPLPQGQGSFG